MTIKEAGLIKNIEFDTEAERNEYIDGLNRMEIEHVVIGEGRIHGDNGTRYFLNIIERDLRFCYPLFSGFWLG